MNEGFNCTPKDRYTDYGDFITGVECIFVRDKNGRIDWKRTDRLRLEKIGETRMTLNHVGYDMKTHKCYEKDN